ncbi:DUF853 domain-containing protein [Desulfovibrio sp. OttesenSCG-928-C14]|nr:DUF853 domain-containing protein [Desulfovibrio sp. OttesenSCG-928-C14]
MYTNDQKALIAMAEGQGIYLEPGMANRHGLITGATGTGKTVTLQTLAESFSQMGVPVFAADMKGDLSGVAETGGNKSSVTKRVGAWGLEARGFAYQGFPVQFWDIFGARGTPVRATMEDMGPLLLARLLDLNDTQSAVLTVVFRIAKDEELDIVDLKDLRTVLEYAALNADKYSVKYGNIAKASIASIQRGLATLEHDGAELFFGEPALDINDFMQTEGGKGVINILAADALISSPKLYSSFLVWLMTKLFEVLPEAGDLPKPKLVFFFDEAHLLFSDAPKVLLDKVEQVVRLIRSKGVGIYFITQTPSDIPDSILGQLGNRVQHALRAYTPRDQKALKAAAQSFRANPAFDTEKAIAELGVGEALVSFLDVKGAPAPVERASVLPPQSQIGPLDEAKRQELIKQSLVYRYYSRAEDRVSAYEILSAQLSENRDEKARAKERKEEEKIRKEAEKAAEKLRKEEERRRLAQEKEEARQSRESKRFWSGMFKSLVVPVARDILRGFGKKR